MSFEALGNRIIKRIELAHAFRQVEQVRELARILINIPIREFQLIAQYYLIWCKCREYQYPATTLERIIEQTQTYKTKALFSRAAIEGFHGDIATAIHFYMEALKTSPSVSEYVDLVRSIAVLKATEGFHNSALKDLENLEPLIKHVEPRVYCDYLNSYALELGEAGRKQEARNISRVMLASPFIQAYPEWQETARDLKEPDRSSVVVSSIILEQARPETTATRHASQPEQPASVVSFPPLKEAPPPQKPERLTPRELNELTASEKGELILAVIKSGTLRDDDYDKLMDMVGLLASGPANKVLDLEDDKVLVPHHDDRDG